MSSLATRNILFILKRPRQGWGGASVVSLLYIVIFSKQLGHRQFAITNRSQIRLWLVMSLVVSNMLQLAVAGWKRQSEAVTHANGVHA